MLKPLVCALFVALLVSIQASDTCPKAYSNCNLGKPGFINVHMVSHTHDDVGWLKTVDQYFYGSNSGNQEATVQYVIDSVVDELSKDPNKRFVYVEIAYFWRWWNEQNDATKQLVRTLVDQGRLEFVIGAWCMDDEANPYYTDMIDQQALGFKFILEEFGPCARPRAAWQIDPFGHSREQASLFAQFGFDGLFLGRIDYQDKDTRENTKTMEMLWQASENLGDAARLFTGILPNGYGPPPGFCFDQYCGDDPIMDDPNLDEYNVDQKVSDFLKYTHQQADAYKTSNLIMTMGSDFQYSNAHRWYKNLDKLIKYVNMEQQKGSNVNIFYSTTACYLYSLNMANTTWPLKYDDFFPYAHRPHSFWTGYFTSRSALKFNVRRTSNILQTVRQLAALADLKDPMAADAINTLERAMGVTQHHDAVAGTEKQHVANDYAKRLWIGTSKCVNVINDSYSAILTHLAPHAQLSNTSVIFCSLLNITECLPIENQNRFTLNIYNPLPRSIESWISLPVVGSGAGYTVTDLSTLKTVTLDIAPVYKEIDLVIERQSHANNRAVFKASLPAMGFSSYSISNGARSQTDEKSDDEENQSVENNNVGGFDIKNANLQMSFDDQGNLVSLVNLNNSLSTTITQTYCIYKSMPGNNSDSEFQASGAYIFRPLEQTPECLSVKDFSVYVGNQFYEVHQIFNEWISQTIRLYEGSKNAEFEWQVGPIDNSDNVGREVVIRFQSDLKSNSLFYTDSNGREMLTRKRDFRPTWTLNQTEPVSGNYYPVNSRIFIRDEVSKRSAKNSNRRQLTLVNDRSQGGSSILDGSVEIMLHRRIVFDDSLGVAEPLNETILNKQGMVVNGIVSLIFDSVEGSARVHRELAHRVNNRPLLTFVLPADESFNSDIYRPLAGWSALGQSTLPPNVHLLTFAKDFDTNHEFTNSLVVRLEHFYENGEDAELSKPVTLNLRDTFNATFNFVGIQELALGANMPVEELNERLTWNSSDDLDGLLNKKAVFKSRASNDFEVTLNPMQIRTFRIFYLPNH